MSELSKREKTREHILDTALALFAEQGFEKATMRGIAKAAGLSLGASYYHFRSKEELALGYYQRSGTEAASANAGLIADTKDFTKRFRALALFKFSQLSEHRSLIKVLARHGADFSHPLSPFSEESKEIREEAIGLIEEAMEGSTIKVHKTLEPYISTILWLYQMGLILYWSNDESPDQERTTQLLDLSLSMLEKLLKLSALPIMRPINSSFTRVLDLVFSGMRLELRGVYP